MAEKVIRKEVTPEWTKWATQLVIDPDGSIWVGEVGFRWDGQHWIPDDDEDPKEYEHISDLDMGDEWIPSHVASQLRFSLDEPVTAEFLAEIGEPE